MFIYVFLVPRYIKRWFYQRWNRFKFRASGVKLGPSSRISDKMGLLVHKSAIVEIGYGFSFVSGGYFNPLVRNLGGAIYAGNNAKIIIGDQVGMSSACLWCTNAIEIGNNVKIGAGSVLIDNDAHNLNYVTRRDSKNDIAASAPIKIGDDVMIGTNVLVLKGVAIGARSIIGAGSVVTKSIPADCIAAGNPCIVIKTINEK